MMFMGQKQPFKAIALNQNETGRGPFFYWSQL